MEVKRYYIKRGIQRAFWRNLEGDWIRHQKFMVAPRWLVDKKEVSLAHWMEILWEFHHYNNIGELGDACMLWLWRSYLRRLIHFNEKFKHGLSRHSVYNYFPGWMHLQNSFDGFHFTQKLLHERSMELAWYFCGLSFCSNMATWCWQQFKYEVVKNIPYFTSFTLNKFNAKYESTYIIVTFIITRSNECRTFPSVYFHNLCYFRSKLVFRFSVYAMQNDRCSYSCQWHD